MIIAACNYCLINFIYWLARDQTKTLIWLRSWH